MEADKRKVLIWRDVRCRAPITDLLVVGAYCFLGAAVWLRTNGVCRRYVCPDEPLHKTHCVFVLTGLGAET